MRQRSVCSSGGATTANAHLREAPTYAPHHSQDAARQGQHQIRMLILLGPRMEMAWRAVHMDAA